MLGFLAPLYPLIEPAIRFVSSTYRRIRGKVEMEIVTEIEDWLLVRAPKECSVDFLLTLMNRGEMPQRVIGMELEIRARTGFLCGSHTFTTLSFQMDNCDVLLEPISRPFSQHFEAFGEGIPNFAPRSIYLVLMLRLAGPIREHRETLARGIRLDS